MYRDYGDRSAWISVLMPLWWIALVGFTAWAVVRLARSAEGRTHDTQPRAEVRETPEEILDRRFAVGEIDADEHARSRKQLQAHPR